MIGTCKRYTIFLFTLATLLSSHADSMGEGQEILADYTFSSEIVSGVDGWDSGGFAEIPRWHPAGMAGWPTATLAIVDEHPDRWGSWISPPVALPEVARVLGRVDVKWEIAHEVETDRIRLSFDLLDGEGERISRSNWLSTGTSAGWEDRTFEHFHEPLPVPLEATHIQFYLVGLAPAVGTTLLNRVTILLPENDTEIIDDGDDRLVPIATWDLDAPDPRSPHVPLDWERVGPPPHVASWSPFISSSGNRSLALIDDDARNAGQWVSRRFPLSPLTPELEFSFDVRPQEISGTWAVAVHFIRQDITGLNGQLLERVDALLSEVDGGLRVDWVRATEDRDELFDTSFHAYTERNPRGFWKITRRVPVVQESRSMRISVRSGPDTSALGNLWLDNPALYAIIPPELSD